MEYSVEARHILNSCGTFDSTLAHKPVNSRIESTVFTRFVKKFQVPSTDNEALLKQQCDESWIEFEHNLEQLDILGNISRLSPTDRCALYKARVRLSEITRGFKLAIKNANINITPGETFIPSQGRVSVFQKLNKKSHWTTTWNCLEDTVDLIYYHPQLKRCAKYWFNWDRSYLRDLYLKHVSTTKDIGREVFKDQLLDNVLTIVDGSRGSSVPKDNEKRRFINVEAFFSVLLQNLLAQFIRRRLKNYGNDLDEGQEHHKQMISDPKFCTIDKSNASDSNHYDQTKWMFDLPSCKKLYEKIIAYRSYNCKIGKEWHTPYKVSSMGNGFTFELMTLILYSIASTLDPLARVYGDDVIVSNAVADQYIRIVEALGWRLNMSKTFVRSPLRESCGAFYDDEYGYITCFDNHYNENLNDVIVTCNKVYRIKTEHTNTTVCEFFSRLHADLLDLVPRRLKGPVLRDKLTLNTHVWVNNSRKIHSNDEFLRERHQKVVNNYQKVFLSWQLHLNGKGEFQKNFPIVVVDTPHYVPKLNSNMHTRKTVKHGSQFASILYAGRRTKDVNGNEGEWRTKLACVTLDGHLFYLSDLTDVLSTWA